MIERRVPTKTQQIIIDSRFRTSGDSNAYVIDLKGIHGSGNTYSNVYLSSFDQVVGIKVLEVYIENTQAIAISSTTRPTAVDFVCPQIPKPAQQLWGPQGYVWCRVPLMRHYTATDPNNLVNQWWQAPHSKTQYFPPTQISRLEITLYPNSPFLTTPFVGALGDPNNYLIVEITSLDRHSDVLP
jgi:hypothetical protein